MSVDMNQTISAASLDNLHDIIVPDSIGFFPLSTGWMIMLIISLALLFHWIVQTYKQYEKTRYKREALKAMEKENGLLELLSLAKRVGIAAYGREKIALLTGDAWWDFMEAHSHVNVENTLRDEIAKCLYDASYSMDSKMLTEVNTMVSVWIKTHKVDSDV